MWSRCNISLIPGISSHLMPANQLRHPMLEVHCIVLIHIWTHQWDHLVTMVTYSLRLHLQVVNQNLEMLVLRQTLKMNHHFWKVSMWWINFQARVKSVYLHFKVYHPRCVCITREGSNYSITQLFCKTVVLLTNYSLLCVPSSGLRFTFRISKGKFWWLSQLVSLSQ